MCRRLQDCWGNFGISWLLACCCEHCIFENPRGDIASGVRASASTVVAAEKGVKQIAKALHGALPVLRAQTPEMTSEFVCFKHLYHCRGFLTQFPSAGETFISHSDGACTSLVWLFTRQKERSCFQHSVLL